MLGCEFKEGRQRGVILTKVSQRKPAGIAGLRINDVIESVNGMPTPNKATFKAVVRKVRPGDRVPFQLEREEDVITVVVPIGSRAMELDGIDEVRRLGSGVIHSSDIMLYEDGSLFPKE